MHANSEISLTPGAGSGIGKLFFEKLLAYPGFLDMLSQAAVDGLQAMTPPRWDKEANDGKGGWSSVPDYRVRVQTLFGLMAQAEGDPIKRVIHQHTGAAGAFDPLAALRDSPALLDAAERLLTKAKWRDRHQAAKRAEPAAPTLDAEFE